MLRGGSCLEVIVFILVSCSRGATSESQKRFSFLVYSHDSVCQLGSRRLLSRIATINVSLNIPHSEK